jgi:hypothetical protein
VVGEPPTTGVRISNTTPSAFGVHPSGGGELINIFLIRIMEFQHAMHPVNKNIMKNQFTISISTPCDQSWNSLLPTSTVGFCLTCKKEVIDFRNMSDDQVIEYFSQRKNNTCGRFYQHQLVHHSPNQLRKSLRYSMIPAGILSLLMFFISADVTGQSLSANLKQDTSTTQVASMNQWVKGYVRADSGEPLPGANVYLKGTQMGTVTDENGYFEFSTPVKEGDILIFSYIGFETQEYVVTKENSENINIKLVMFAELTGEVQVGQLYEVDNSPGIWNKIKAIFK